MAGFGFGQALGGLLGGLFGDDQSTRRLTPGDVSGPIQSLNVDNVRAPNLGDATFGFLGAPTAAEFRSPEKELAAQAVGRFGIDGAIRMLQTAPEELNANPHLARGALSSITEAL